MERRKTVSEYKSSGFADEGDDGKLATRREGD